MAGAGLAHADEYGMSDDPRLAPARESFYEGQKYLKRGEQEFRRRPGQAQKWFEHAEDYFLKAAFQYENLGNEYGMDVSNELEICDHAQSKVHVMVNKARKKGSRAGGPQRH